MGSKQPNKNQGMEEIIQIPDKIIVSIDGDRIMIKGPKGSGSRKIPDPRINIKFGEKQIIMTIGKQSKKEKKIMNSFVSHINNLLFGVVTPHTYLLKICSGHFPMNVSISNNQIIIKNFIGEKVPRSVPIKPNTKVEIKGNEILVESVDKELAGQMAAAIEQTTRRPGYDLRVFQDGIYIVNKAGKPAL